MRLVDTHCHIQNIVSGEPSDELVESKWEKAGITDPQRVIQDAHAAGVTQLMVVGCSLRDSKRAIELAAKEPSCYASIGIHPHEAKLHETKETREDFATLAQLPEVHAIGECGLDYYYGHSPKNSQIKLLEFQLQAAQDHDLPVIFHVRDAYEDFWPVFDQFQGLRGVLHSYTDTQANLNKALDRGLYIGLNGIMTFTKDQKQREMAAQVPLLNLLLETDAPFLTPAPHRGRICTPKYVVDTAKFLCQLRGESLERMAAATTHNAKELFRLP